MKIVKNTSTAAVFDRSGRPHRALPNPRTLRPEFRGYSHPPGRRLATSLLAGLMLAALTLASVSTATERGPGPGWAINRPGNLLIADQFNNRVIRVSPAGQIVISYGLPLAGGDPIGNNVGYDLQTTQNGLYAPYDAKVVGDHTGLTPPFGFFDGFGGDHD